MKAIKWYIRKKKNGHPRADSQGLVKQSVLVMEEYLGRYLLPNEQVHHKNGIVTDDHLENLELLTEEEHKRKYNNLGKYNDSPRNTKGRPFYGNQFVKIR
jgi:hypothetical protein